MAQQALTLIGRTGKPFGLKGQLKIRIDEEYLEDFLQLEVVFIHQKGHPLPFFIEEIEEKGGMLLLQVEDIDNKEKAQALTSCEVFIQDKDILREEERTFDLEHLQAHVLVGFKLFDETAGLIGVIEEVVEYPQQEMSVLQYQGRELLIPINEQLISKLEEETKEIYFDLPEGMLDL